MAEVDVELQLSGVPNRGMNEVKLNLDSPDSDCNSNHTNSNSNALPYPPDTLGSCGSIASSQDFTHDNSDYQWFLDYGYRDPSSHQHVSILSSLTTSYTGLDGLDGLDGIGYYDVMAKNLDANLAEVDMESFRTEDIHSLLTTLPAICSDLQLPQEVDRQGEMFASVSGSIMAKIDFESSISDQSTSQGEDFTGSAGDTMSICKSELLFSPVKETPMPGVNFSVDSLDMDMLSEHDLILTCQANKNNYTIAFEGSVTMYSEDSESADIDKSKKKTCPYGKSKSSRVRCSRGLDASMACSDMGFTTWSQLKKQSGEFQLLRHPSGNNNVQNDSTHYFVADYAAQKSQSMPDLNKLCARKEQRPHHRHAPALSNSSVYSCRRLPLDDIKVFSRPNPNTGSLMSEMVSSNSTCSRSAALEPTSNEPNHNFNLVKLFMKQKSISNEGMSICMDVSSECWPASHSEGGDSGDSFETDIKYKSQHDIKILNSRNRILDRNTDNVRTANDGLVTPKIDDKKISNNTTTDTKDTSGIKKSLCNDYNITFNQTKDTKHIFNVNNNNSFERDISPCNFRKNIKYGKLQNLTNPSGSVSSNGSVSILSCSSSEDTEITKIPQGRLSKITNTPFQTLIDCSVQTSFFANSLERQNQLKVKQQSDLMKVIEPSFLSKLKHESSQIPIYVMYPNYALPNLDFLQDQKQSHKVFLRPQTFKEKDRTQNNSANSRRPLSCNDIEALRKKGFGHIWDWDSLTFLLPNEYRQVLADVPEIFQHIKGKEENLLRPREKPLFCVSPPVRHRTRPVSCDCNTLTSNNQTTNVSSSSSTATQPSSGYRGSSTMLTDSSSQMSPAQTKNTNPLFIYRYDSVTSSEASLLMSEKQKSLHAAPPLPKRSISLPIGNPNCDTSSPPRPPLPKGILRKLDSCKFQKNNTNCKRYSMCEVDHDVEKDEDCTDKQIKRRSLQEPYYLSETKNKDAKTTNRLLYNKITASPVKEEHENILSIPKLDKYLIQSDLSTPIKTEWNNQDVLKHRSNVSNFLIMKMENDLDGLNMKKTVSFAEQSAKNELLIDHPKEHPFVTPPNSPNVSAITHRQYQTKNLTEMPISEESELSPEREDINLNQRLIRITTSTSSKSTVDLNQKRGLVSAVTDAVEKLIQHFSSASDQTQLSMLGDSSVTPACAKLVLSTLCPALYAILSDGLKTQIESSFGAINNSVWHVVEASAQLGPITQFLHDLVMRINSIDVITEGLLKFNAFIFGLLNVRSLDGWASYLRTRESVIKKHYNTDSLLVMDATSGVPVRSLFDTLLASLEPLAILPFSLDIMFEHEELHKSLQRISALHQTSQDRIFKQSIQNSRNTMSNQSMLSDDDLINNSAHTSKPIRDDSQRPRSFVAHEDLGHDIACTIKKRWSGVQFGSKLFEVFDRLVKDTEEEYSDSLEHDRQLNVSSNDTDLYNMQENENEKGAALNNGGKFRRLQKKWEMLSGTDCSPVQSPSQPVKSRIPRPVTSPVKPSSAVTSPLSPPPLKPKRCIPVPIRKSPGAPTAPQSKKTPVLTSVKRQGTGVIRTSRVDMQPDVKHTVRPSSLPYRPSTDSCSTRTPISRRAASTSQVRTQKTNNTKNNTRTVRTLCHRLPSDAGHLSFNEGEKLRLVLEVDSKWLLCCRGDQKGLVPRNSVIYQ